MVVPIAPSTYYEQKARRTDPSRVPPRVRRDAFFADEIQRVWDENHSVYGARKVWRQLRVRAWDTCRCATPSD
jgi:putative transposase